MLSHNGQVVLRGETARNFFYAARHPDREELRRRDQILAEIEQNFSYREDGTDLVMDIPDIDLHRSLSVIQCTPSCNIVLDASLNVAI